MLYEVITADIKVWKQGYLTAPGQTIDLTSSSTLQNLILGVGDAQIQGTVSDSIYGYPLENMVVTAYFPAGDTYTVTRTDFFGEYNLNVPAGTTWYVFTESRPYSFSVQSGARNNFV